MSANAPEHTPRMRGQSDTLAPGWGHAFDPQLICQGCYRTWQEQREAPIVCPTPIFRKVSGAAVAKSSEHLD